MTYILRLIVALCFLFPGYSGANAGSSLTDSITRSQSDETIVPLAGRRPPGRPGGHKARGSKPKSYKARSYKPSTQKVAPGKSRPKQAAKPASKGKTYSKARRDAPGKSAKAKSSKAKSSKAGPKTYQKPKSAAPGKQRTQSAAKSKSIPAHLPKKIHAGKQGKHIPGHNNYIAGKSTLNRSVKAQKLLDGVHSGRYKVVGRTPSRGHPVVNFKKPIGNVYGKSTHYGSLHIGKDGVHIVPHVGKIVRQ